MAKAMQKKFWRFLKKNAPSIATLLFFGGSTKITVTDPGLSIECLNPKLRDPGIFSLTLRDGRFVELDRLDVTTWKLSLLKSDKKTVLWSKIYVEDEEINLWNEAQITYVKDELYEVDINHDGYPEIAVYTYAGGNHSCNPAVLYTVKEKELIVYKIIPYYNFESCKSILLDNENPRFTDSDCQTTD